MHTPCGGYPLLADGPETTSRHRKSAGIFADPKTKGTASAVPFVYRDDLPLRPEAG